MINISASMQDYLEVILELNESENSVRVTDVAMRLGIAKASVNQTIKKLKKLGLVTHEVYGPIQLTAKGIKVAEEVRQRHKTLFIFLNDVLGVDVVTAENDACLMEHAISEQTMEKLKEFLANNQR